MKYSGKSFGAICGLLAVLLLLWWIPSSPLSHSEPKSLGTIEAHPEVAHPMDLERVDENATITNQATPALEAGLLGKIEDSEGQVVISGWVEFSTPHGENGISPVERVGISDGSFTFPSSWLEGSRVVSDQFLYRSDSGIPSPIEFAGLNQGAHDLILRVGSPRQFHISVVDDQGVGIEGVEVEVFAPLPLPNYGLRTNQEGMVEGILYGSNPNAAFRATKLGYFRNHVTLDLSKQGSATIELASIYLAILLRRDWPGLNPLLGFLPGDSLNPCSHDPGLAEVRKEILRILPEPEEGFQYDLQFAYSILTAPLNGRSPRLSIAFFGEEGFRSQVETFMMALSKGIPEVFEIPIDSYPPDTVTPHEVRIELLPKTTFLAAPPLSLSLRFSAADPSGHDLILPGKLAEGTTYSFLLPKGTYRVGSSPDEYLDENPRLLTEVDIKVVENVQNRFKLFLDPDEKWITYDLVGKQSGRRIPIAALLAPQNDKPKSIWPSAGVLPRGRFIRPGSFDLWYVDHHGAEKVEDLFKTLEEGLFWPSPVTANGLWLIPLDIPESHPESFTSG